MSEPTEPPPQLVDLNLCELERDDDSTQAREAIDLDTVEQYGELMKGGTEFDPIVVFADNGRYYVADGWHRVDGCEFGGLDTIRAEVRHGTKQDARDYATSDIGRHGRPMTNGDKRKAITWVLEDHPDWSERAVAKHVGVGRPLVAKVRQETEGNRQPATLNRRGRGSATDRRQLEALREPYVRSLQRLRAIEAQLNEWRQDVECGAYVRQDFAHLAGLLHRLRSSLDRLTPVRWCDQCDRSERASCGVCLQTGFRVRADLENTTR